MIAFRLARAPGALRAGVLIGVTVLALAAVRFEATPLLRGPAPYPPEWQWAAAAKPWSARVLPAVACAAGLVTLLLLSGRAAPRRHPAACAALVACTALLGVALQLALRHVDEEGAVAGLVRRTISGSFTSFHRVAASGVARDPAHYLAHHHELLPRQRHRALHAATHPPGPVLFYSGLVELCRWSKGLTVRLGAIVSDSGLATETLASPPPSPESIGAALLGPLLLGLLGALACWPTAALARSLHGDAAAAARTGVLWTMVPAVVLMTPELDQALALPVTASIAALAAALRPQAGGPGAWMGHAAAAGVLAAVAEFFSYGAAVFVMLGALAVLASSGWESRRRAAAAVGLAVAAGAAVVGLERLAGHRPLDSALAALSIHRQEFTVRRSYPTWLAFDSLDLFWFLGPPLALLVVATLARAVFRRAGVAETCLDRFRAAAVLGVAALVLSGIVRGEAGRILIPLMPVLLVAAVTRKGPEDAAAGPSVGLSVLLGGLLTATSLVIRLTWDVP